MEACGYDATAEGVARCYHDFLDLIVVDTSDAGMAREIRTEDSIAVETTNLRISDPDAAARLAEFVIRKAHENSSTAREGLL